MPLPGIGFLALVALAQTAPAVSVPVRVEFDAPAGCSDAESFFSGVFARTRHVHQAGPKENAVRLAIRLTRVGARVRGELRLTELGGASEIRRVDGATCAEVVQVLSLTAALAIDPTAEMLPLPTPPAPRAAPAAPATASPSPSEAASPSSPSPSPSSPAAPPPAPPAAPPAPPTPAPPEPPPPPPPEPAPPEPTPPAAVVEVAPPSPLVPPPPPGTRLGAAMTAARVLSSSVALGASLSGRFGTVRGSLRPNVAVNFLFLPGDVFESGDNLGIRWTALAVAACPGWWLGGGRTVLEPCARLTMGLLYVTDHSISNPQAADRWWGSAGALVHLAAPIGAGFGLDVDAGVDFPFVTRRFITTTVEPNQGVGATTAVSPTLSVGLSHAL